MNLTEFLNSDLTEIAYFFHPAFLRYGEKPIDYMSTSEHCYDISQLLDKEKLDTEIWTSPSPNNVIHGTDKYIRIIYPNNVYHGCMSNDYVPFASSGGIFAVATKDIKSHGWIINAVKERIKDWPNYINYCLILRERSVNNGKVLDLIIRGFDITSLFKSIDKTPLLESIIEDLKTHPKNKQDFRTL